MGGKEGLSSATASGSFASVPTGTTFIAFASSGDAGVGSLRYSCGGDRGTGGGGAATPLSPAGNALPSSANETIFLNPAFLPFPGFLLGGGGLRFMP